MASLKSRQRENKPIGMDAWDDAGWDEDDSPLWAWIVVIVFVTGWVGVALAAWIAS